MARLAKFFILVFTEMNWVKKMPEEDEKKVITDVPKCISSLLSPVILWLSYVTAVIIKTYK